MLYRHIQLRGQIKRQTNILETFLTAHRDMSALTNGPLTCYKSKVQPEDLPIVILCIAAFVVKTNIISSSLIVNIAPL